MWSWLQRSSGPAHARVPQHEQDTLSASVNLEDIIDQYDGNNKEVAEATGTIEAKTTTQRPASSYSNQTLTEPSSRSQTYFSLSAADTNHSSRNGINHNPGCRDDSDAENFDETTSFYSASQDAYVISTNPSDPDLKFKHVNFFGNMKRSNGSGQNVAALRNENFEVIWNNLSYTIRPKNNIWLVWYEIKHRLSPSYLMSVLFRRHSNAYTCNEQGKVDVEGSSEHHNDMVDSLRRYNDEGAIEILRNINGSIKSGELTAILGPSGAGKTSLLNCLSRRKQDNYSGQLRVVGSTHKLRISSIPQDDHLPEYLTVKENLIFASRLKNCSRDHDHEKYVSKVSDLLGLNVCLETRTRNISGGQLKRLSIAQELLSRTDILILDEPTSGLDSSTCIKALSVLRDLVRSSAARVIDPIAIVLTIHQPQREAFDMFDKVYVLANGGIPIYNGPPDQCIQFIEKHAGIKAPVENYNPALFLVEIASGEYGQDVIKALSRQVALEIGLPSSKSVNDMQFASSTSRRHPNTEDSPVAAQNLHHISYDNLTHATKSPRNAELPQPTKGGAVNKSTLVADAHLPLKSGSEGNFVTKTLILTERCFVSLLRDRYLMVSRLFYHIIVPVSVALMMNNNSAGQYNSCPRFRTEYSLKRLLDTDEYTSSVVQTDFMLSLQNFALLFLLTYASISISIAAMTLVFSLDLKTSLKEYYNGWYSMNSYLIARLVSNIPLDLILPSLTFGLAWTLTQQNLANTGSITNLYRMLIIDAGIIMGSQVGQILAMIFAAIFLDHLTTALFATQGITLPFVLLSGFIVRVKNMTAPVRALSFISWYRHVIEILMIGRYGFNVCGCDPKDEKGGQDNVRITGVPEKLKSFVEYWQSMQSVPDETDNSTITAYKDDDLFQLIARQVSLYNTYGIDVKTCENDLPYHLIDYDLNDKDLLTSFARLAILLLMFTVTLFITIRLIVRYRTSL